jgi:pimeloyl-ACP methyl ester carboxylesterase
MSRLEAASRSAGVTSRHEDKLSLSNLEPETFTVGNPPVERRIAFRLRAPVRSGFQKGGAGEKPGLVWFGGYRSDMASTKASALDAIAERLGLGLLRFDYSGHGRSEGRLEDGTISRWLEEALTLVRARTEGPQIVIGSSMGGYLALLAARALQATGEASRLAGLVLIAPAVDFTESLVWNQAPEAARRAIMDEGAWRRPSAYSDEPDVFTRVLIEDGRRHLIMNGMIRTHCPTVVLQGMRDDAVPYAHALKLMERLGGDPATLTLIKDGDHRLSRPQDLALLNEAIERMIEQYDSIDSSQPEQPSFL